MVSQLDPPRGQAGTPAEPQVAPVRPSRPSRIPYGPWLVAIGLVVITALYLAPHRNRGWIPHDEGLLAHTAERVLGGELPHRDFDDAYTGGLAFLHAAAFQILGPRLTSLRAVLLVFSLASIPALYFLAQRNSPWWLAALTVGACLVWSLPNYFAGLPSWYILFLTLFGTAATMQFSSTGRRRWLLVAGLCAGLAITIKIVGLYFLAAASLFLVYQGQVLSAAADAAGNRRRSPAMFVLTLLICGVFLALLLLLLRRHLQAMELIHFVLPSGMLCGLLVWNEWREGRGPWLPRVRQLAGNAGLLYLGAALPILALVLPYAWSGGLAELGHGVLVAPQQRFEFASEPMQPLITMAPVALPAILLACIPIVHYLKLSRWIARTGQILLAAFFAVACPLLLFGQAGYYWSFYSLRGLLPVAVAVACLVLLGKHERLAARQRLDLFLLSGVACLGVLIQYPFAALIYFCYCAPLVLLTVHAVMCSQQKVLRLAHGGLLVFYLLFGLLQLNASMGTDPRNRANEYTAPLTMPRGGLLVRAEDQKMYEEVVRLVRENSPENSFIYAAPDCPEVYFLSGRRNPSRTIYDFFAEPEGHATRTARMLDQFQVPVVVINRDPWFSEKMSPELLAEIGRRFPRMQQVGTLIVAARGAAEPRAASESLSRPASVPTADAKSGDSPPIRPQLAPPGAATDIVEQVSVDLASPQRELQ